jgi:hypothetical protein
MMYYNAKYGTYISNPSGERRCVYEGNSADKACDAADSAGEIVHLFKLDATVRIFSMGGMIREWKYEKGMFKREVNAKREERMARNAAKQLRTRS